MTSNIFTKRLAIIAIDFEVIPISRIYKIFETILGKALPHVRQYVKDDKIFAVAEFSTIEDAKFIYDSCDDSTIDNTKEQFNLSFVPDSFELPDHVDESISSKEYFHKKSIHKSEIDYENMIEASDCESLEESSCDKNGESVDTEDKSNFKEKSPKDMKGGRLAKAIENEGILNEAVGFKPNVIDDPRFSNIFTSSEFGLDASNPKFKNQKCSFQIVEEKRKRHALEDRSK